MNCCCVCVYGLFGLLSVSLSMFSSFVELEKQMFESKVSSLLFFKE